MSAHAAGSAACDSYRAYRVVSSSSCVMLCTLSIALTHSRTGICNFIHANEPWGCAAPIAHTHTHTRTVGQRDVRSFVAVGDVRANGQTTPQNTATHNVFSQCTCAVEIGECLPARLSAPSCLQSVCGMRQRMLCEHAAPSVVCMCATLVDCLSIARPHRMPAELSIQHTRRSSTHTIV